MSSRIFTRLSKAERRGGGERASGARIHGKRRAEGRKTMWMRRIMFVELCFMGLAAKGWVSERSRTNSRRTCLSARHGAQLDVLLLLSWRRHRIPKRSNFPTQRFRGSRTRVCFHVLDLQWGHAYLSDHLKVLLPAEINRFPVEEPLKFGIQGRIAGDLTRQNQALSCGDVHAQRRNRNPGGFYVKKQEKRITFCCL